MSRSIESMLRERNTFSRNRNGIPASIQTAINEDKAFAKELLAIANDKSTSVEHYKQVFAFKVTEANIMSNLFAKSIEERENHLRFAKKVIKSQPNSQSKESVGNELINILSIESFGDFMKGAWENIKTLIKKIINAITAFIKMVVSAIRSKFAGIQSKFYTDHKKEDVAKALAANKDKKIKGKLWTASIGTTSSLSSELEKIEKSVKEITDYKLDKNLDALNKLGDTILGGKDINKDNDDNKSTRTMVNKEIYGSSKQPESKEHTVEDILGQGASNYEMCSKEWLDKAGSIIKSSKELNKACDKLLKDVEKAAKKAGGKDATEEAKKEAKSDLAKISKLRLRVSYASNYVYDYFWTLLNCRSYVYRAAKAVVGEAKKDDKKKK